MNSGFCFIWAILSYYIIMNVESAMKNLWAVIPSPIKAIIKKAVYLLPVCISVALFLIICAINNLYPIGTRSVSWCDMNQQAIPILAEYKDVLSGKSSLFISYGNAGGMNFFVLFLYYCTSPFNLLLAFVDKGDILAAPRR